MHDAWVAYVCVNCSHLNAFRLGNHLLSPTDAFENQNWLCTKCGQAHEKNATLPFAEWPEAFKQGGSIQAQRFWQGFFRIATEHLESYWKWCNVCDRVLPFAAFSRHVNWGPLERQMECRSCKGSINAKLNPLRSTEQLREGATRRRAADLLLEGRHERIDVDDLFRRFDGKCFKSRKLLHKEDRGSWAIDHILPSAYLYPLSQQNAALLSTSANAAKRDKWPSQFYTNQELIDLSRITGADLELLATTNPVVNSNINVNACVTRSLTVREKSDLGKRIRALKGLIKKYRLTAELSAKNKKILGL